MKIRPFAHSDAPTLYAIQLKCPQAGQWHEHDYLEVALDENATILVVETETSPPREVAGFLVIQRVMDEAEIRNLAIDPSYQRKGVARALLAEGIRRMESLGARRLFLEVRASNWAAIELYRRTGFHPLYTRPGYYRDPADDALVMACDLASPSDMLS